MLKNDKGKEDFSYPVRCYPPHGEGILRHIRPKAEPYGAGPFFIPLYDLTRFTDDEIKGSIMSRVFLLMLKHIFDPDLLTRLPGILSLMKTMMEEGAINAIHGFAGCEVVELNLQPDHVHLAVMIPPKVSILNLLGRLKGQTSMRLFHQFRNFKKPYLGNHFWAQGYCVDTVGCGCLQFLSLG